MYKKDYFEKLQIIDRAIKEDRPDPAALMLLKDEDYQDYFFNTVSSITWFEELEKREFFNAKNNPPPILDRKRGGYRIPQWTVLSYLEKLSQRERQLDDRLLEIMKNATLFRNADGDRVDNYRTSWFFVKILTNIPLAEVPVSFFTDVVPLWMDSKFNLTMPGADLLENLLPQYITQATNKEDRQKLDQFASLLFEIEDPIVKKGVLGTLLDVKTKIEDYWLKKTFLEEDKARLLAEKCSNIPIFHLADIIKKVFDERDRGEQDFSSIWLRDLSQVDQKDTLNTEYLLGVILRKLVVEKAKCNYQDGKELINRFLSRDYPQYLFKRLAIVMIAEDWEEYYEFFNMILNSDKNYFENDSFHPELVYLLNKNANKLTNSQKKRIVEIIEKGPSQDLPAKKKSAYKAHWKQSWYKDLDSVPEFKKLYEDLKQVTKVDVARTTYKNFDESRWINFDKSPITSEEMLSKSNEELVAYINTYKPRGEFPEASPEGLYRTFQSAVESNPERIVDNLTPFNTQNYHLLESLFHGLEEAWKQGKDIGWDNVLDFTLALLQESWFWKPSVRQRNNSYDYFDWTISAIADLIQEGTRRDGRSLPVKRHEDVEKIIIVLMNHLSINDKSYHGAGIDHALNSSPGKTITALIYLSLSEARNSDKKDERKKSKWSKSLKDSFENALKLNVYEAYTLLGQYLPNLYYIDSLWVEEKITKIYLKEAKLLETFMEGYLFASQVNDKLYRILRKTYEKTIEITFQENRTQERLVQHIAIGYLRGNEKLQSNSLIGKLFNKSALNIRETVEFVWHQRDHVLGELGDNYPAGEKEQFIRRVFDLWDYILIFLEKRKIGDEEKKLLSELSKLAVYLGEITEKDYRRLAVSAPYVGFDFNTPYFLEYLNVLKDKGNKKLTAKYVALLFIEMLKGSKDLVPDYKWEHINEIVSYLYRFQDKEIRELVNEICILYAERGNLGLRTLYEANNDKNNSVT